MSGIIADMVLLLNKKARTEYSIEQTYTCGIVLIGSEVKSLRNKSGSLSGSYVKLLGGEAYLLNAQITPYKFSDNRDYESTRTRKLLLKKKELLKLEEITAQKGNTIIPLGIHLVHNKIKVEIGVGRGLKQFEKREKIKKRTQQRSIERMMKNRW